MKRRLKPEVRRELILDAAAEEFARRGHRGARMDDIAAAAGVTKPVLYDHFGGKGALHAAVISRASDELVAAVIEAVATAEGTPEERYSTGLVASFRIIAARADVRTLLLGEPGADAAVAQASMAAQARARQAMAGLYLAQPGFLAGRRDRRARAVQVAQAGIGTINALAVLGVTDGLSPEQLADVAHDVLWPGISGMIVT